MGQLVKALQESAFVHDINTQNTTNAKDDNVFVPKQEYISPVTGLLAIQTLHHFRTQIIYQSQKS